jgi:hypothetical protein
MNRNSKVVRTTRETVSLETLQSKLPKECWEAVQKSLVETSKNELSDDVYVRYFQSTPTIPLSEEEKAEVFETIGSDLVKGHYSTEQLRSFIVKEPHSKKRR